MHVLKLECLGKLPFGTYTEIERSGTNLTEIDTTDCENSLSSLKRLAVRLNVKDPANVLPGNNGGLSSDALPSGNETDSCDDNQYDNDNDESNVDDSPSSNGAGNKDEDDDPDTGSEAVMLLGNCHASTSEGTDSGGSLTSLANNNNNNNTTTHLKRKPDDSSTTSSSSANSNNNNESNGGAGSGSSSSGTSSSIGGGEPKRAKFHTASELGINVGPGES